MSDRPYRSGVAVKFGPLTSIYVNVWSAIERDEPLSNVCVNGHDPAVTGRPFICPVCEARDGFVKGKAMDDGTVVVIDPEQVKATGADDAVKTSLVITAHPAGDVLTHTIPGGSTYYLSPGREWNGKSGIKGYSQANLDEGYALLRMLIAANPDKALCTVYAPSTRAGMWRLGLLGDVVTLTALAWPQSLRAAPALPEVRIGDAELDLGRQLLEQHTEAFDPAAYVDTARAAREELVRSAVAGESPAITAPPKPSNVSMGLLEALQAAVVKDEAAKATKAAPKRRARKAS
jgi:non-homologous end joining protein Ku